MTRYTIVAILMLALAGPARAQDAPSPEQLEQAKAAYIEGRRLIDEEKNLQAGVAKFKEAYRLSRNALLLYNIGLAFDELKQKTLALFYYKKFLTDAPEGAPNRDLATERIAVLEKEAVGEEVGLPGGSSATDPFAPDGGTTGEGGDQPAAKVEPKPKPEVEPKPKPAPAKVTEFQHKVVEEAPPNTPLDLTAFVPDEARWQVKLHYRGSGQLNYETVGMEQRYSELVGRIPAEAMQGSSIQYYIEARDPTGKVVARAGRSTSPNLVLIDEGATAHYYPDVGEDLGGGGTSGAGFGGGGGAGGPVDRPARDTLFYLKWGATGTAAGGLVLGFTFYFVAANAGSGLEGEAFESSTEGCAMGNPCRSFSDDQKSLESRGQTFETLSNVMLFTGLVAAGAAGYFWYKDIKRGEAGETSSAKGASVTAVPVVTGDFVGGAAAVRF